MQVKNKPLVIFIYLLGFLIFLKSETHAKSKIGLGRTNRAIDSTIIIDSFAKSHAYIKTISGNVELLYIDSTDNPYIIIDSSENIIGLIDKAGHIRFLPSKQSSPIIFATNLKPFLIFLFIYIILIITFFILRSVFRKKDVDNTNSEDSGSIWKYYVTRLISVVLLITFVLGLAGLFLVNCIVDNNTQVNEKWFEIFKNFLLLLGTSFTTIMGYFFGQGQAEKLEKSNSKLEQQKDELKSKINAVEELSESLRKQRDQIANLANSMTTKQEPIQL